MSVNQSTARVSIVADVANANAGMRKLSAQVAKLERQLEKTSRAGAKAGGKLERSFERVEKSSKMMATGLGLAGVAGAASGAYHALGAAAERSMQLDSAQRNLKFSIDAARKSTMGMVTDFDLMQRANQASALGVANNAQEFAQLSEMAVKLGQQLGMTTDQAYESLIGSLGRGSSAMLDNLGVSLKLSEAQAIYASRLGKSVSALTDAERKAAFQTIAYERLMKATNEVNIETDNAAAGMARLKTSIDNMIDEAYQIPEMLQEIGRNFEGVFLDIVGAKTPEAIEVARLGLEQFIDYGRAGVQGLTLDFEGALASIGSFDKGVRALANQTVRNFKQTDAYQDEQARKARRRAVANARAGVNDFFGQAMEAGAIALAEEEAAKKNKKARRGGRGRKATSNFANRGSTEAFDLGDAAGANRAAMFSKEADELARAAEIQAQRFDMAIAVAEDEDQRHLLRMTALEQQKAAEEEIFAARIQAATYAGDQDEVRELQHEAEMMRLESQAAREQQLAVTRDRIVAEEKRRLEQQRQSYIAWGQTTGSVMSGFASTYAMAAEQAGVSDEKRQKAAMRMGGIVSMTEATVAGVKAAVAYASGNIPQGVALTAAAGFAAAQGAMLLSGNIPGGVAGSSGGASASGGAADPDRFGTGNAPGSRVPGSATAVDERPRPSGRDAAGGSGGSVTLVYSPGVQVGDADQETAEELLALVKRGGLGSFNA